MTAHVRRVASLLSPNGLWDTGSSSGLAGPATRRPTAPGDAKADPGVVATACAYRTASLVAATAGILGRSDEQREFSEMAAGLRNAFN